MGDLNPEGVICPKDRWRLRRILHDAGERSWSGAERKWENNVFWGEVLAHRWNGSNEGEIGNPRSRGLATWLIVLFELERPVRDAIAAFPGARRRS